MELLQYMVYTVYGTFLLFKQTSFFSSNRKLRFLFSPILSLEMDRIFAFALAYANIYLIINSLINFVFFFLTLNIQPIFLLKISIL